jgi:adenine C2-methylase RlmN of 23S rRNA A2503 and tRNA A37
MFFSNEGFHAGRFGLGYSKISVSTVGIVPKIYKMMEDIPHVCLALSVHGGTQETRLKIVPSAKAYPIEKILQAADAFVDNQNQITLRGPKDMPRHSPEFEITKKNIKNKRRKLMMEYVLLGPDVNCLPQHAHEIGSLIAANEVRRQQSILNVIPYNPTTAGDRFAYVPPNQDQINEFLQIVRGYGVVVTVRQELGQDVNAACGQLVVQSSGKKNAVRDMEDLLQPASISRSSLRARKSKLHTAKSGKNMETKLAKTVDRKMFLIMSLCFLVTVRLGYQLWISLQ